MLNFKKYEAQLVNDISNVFNQIIECEPFLNIRAKSRAGAEISEYLEDKFVEFVNKRIYQNLSNPDKSPKGATKNPFDAKCDFTFESRQEIIWIDIKAFKLSSIDSNPDIGTINKVISFINHGNFYILFVLVFYNEESEGLKFIKLNGKFTKTYLLKNVSKTFRLNPKNQLQVNMKAEPEYRTREEFIKLLQEKHSQCLYRMIESSNKKLKTIDEIYLQLLEKNKEVEGI